MGRHHRALLACAAAASVVTATAADARGRLGIGGSFGMHGGGIRSGGGFSRPGAGGSGTLHGGGGSISRPGQGGSGTRDTGGNAAHGGMVGWDQASRGPPRPDPNPGPGPKPGPRPDPYPVPVPVPYAGWGPYWDDWDNWYDWGGEYAAGVVAGTVVGAAVASQPTTVVVGTVVDSLPANCAVEVQDNVTYEQCGNVWYKPQYIGTTVQYVVVTPP